jgi:hypothetical protein
VGASVIDFRPQTACYLGTRGRRAQREEGDETLGMGRDMHFTVAAHEAEPAEQPYLNRRALVGIVGTALHAHPGQGRLPTSPMVWCCAPHGSSSASSDRLSTPTVEHLDLVEKFLDPVTGGGQYLVEVGRPAHLGCAAVHVNGDKPGTKRLVRACLPPHARDEYR